MNSFADWCELNNEKLLKEWDYDNNNLTPYDVSPHSNIVVNWKCEFGHKWSSSINNRNKSNGQGNGCPFCSGHKVLKGFNDFETWCKNNKHFNLLKEWDYSNNDKKPSEVTCGSHYLAMWKCSQCGKKWKTAVKARVSHPNSNCVNCSHKKQMISMIESKIIEEGSLKDNYPDIALEWDYSKNGKLKPENVTKASNKIVWWICPKKHSYRASINHRTSKKSDCPYCSGHKVLKGFNDLETTDPDIVCEWNYQKNETIKPSQISRGSNKKVWWLCKNCGYEWYGTVCDRIRRKTCPNCSTENKTSFPEQAILYYIKKSFPDAVNGDRNVLDGKELDIYIPSKKTAVEYDGKNWHKSTERDEIKSALCLEKKVNLIRIREIGCPPVNNYTDVIYNVRYEDYEQLGKIISLIISSLKGEMPDIDIARDRLEIFSQYIFSIKEKSFAQLFPEKLNEWDYEANGKLNPETVTIGSKKKIYWKCSQGHSYQQNVRDKVLGRGCPICSNHIVVRYQNDFETWCKNNNHSEYLREWDYKLNKLKPYEVTPGSGVEIWWKCPLGHSYKSLLYIHKKGIGCPYCSSSPKKVKEGFNDLQTLRPDLALEWDYNKNGDLKPEKVMAGSGKKVWWICPKGHSYYAAIYSRNSGTGCPFCGEKKAQKRVLLEEKKELFNSFTEATKKYGINGSSISLVCNGKLKTAGGYHWRFVNNQSNQKESLYNWCKSNNEEKLLEEWNYEKNSVNPNIVSRGSNKKIFWKCSRGHEWETSVKNRTRGTGCPYCQLIDRKRQRRNN